VYWRIGGWYVIDRGSTNGTFMNGSGVKTLARLADGDQLHLDRRVRLRFERSLRQRLVSMERPAPVRI
jgi:pSer/pThr/pTyr-binding forkhead associated (FHA) protein